jgi:hypothetical protein
MTYYYWDFDTDNVFLEEDENGNVLAEYKHEPGRYGGLIAQERDGQVRYYNFDGQGSTRELTDENGAVTDTYTYTAFGEEIAHTGTTDTPFRYGGALGYYTDNDPNGIYVRERVYEPTNGRWLSPSDSGERREYTPAKESPRATGVASAHAPWIASQLIAHPDMADETVAKNKGLSDEDFRALTCGCSEVKATPAFMLFVKIKDYELRVNVKSLKSMGPDVTIERKSPLVDLPGLLGITVIVEREYWEVACCVNKSAKTSRFVGMRELKKPKDTSVNRGVPAGFNLTRSNMEAFAEFVFSPLPMWHYGAADDDLIKKCLAQSGWDSFGPKTIEKDSVIKGINTKE